MLISNEHMDDIIRSFLNSDPNRNIAITGFFSNYPVKSYFIEQESALILGESDHLWAHIASSSASELVFLLKKYHKLTKYYFSVENWMIPLILEYGEPDWIMKTNRYILDLNVPTDLPKLEIVNIDSSFVPFMFENSDYKEFISVEYIEDRIRKDISAGILINKQLVAWGFTHDDGALGFLNVVKEYRNKGYGSDVLLALILLRKKEKKPIFGNVVPDNHKSSRLLIKLGFKLDSEANWVKLK
jgi:8-oxo-dGTP diphosphatase